MTMMFLMIPVALLMSAGAVAAFVWAVRRGQLDDLVTPAVRILHEEERQVQPAAPPNHPPLPGSAANDRP